MLTRVLRPGKTVTSFSHGNSIRFLIPLDYIRLRELEPKMKMYAHLKTIGDMTVFCYSEFPADTCVEVKVSKFSDKAMALTLPEFFYTALNHEPGDKYEVYHNGKGTLIMEKTNQ